jgi:hypothetical protein
MATISYQLREIKDLEKSNTSMDELNRMEGRLYHIENQLENIKRFFPRNIQKRGLFDIGGSALQYLFGVATQIDVKTLQETVQKLHSRQDLVAHSVQQISYFKQLDENVASDHKTLGILTRDLQDFVQKAQEAFQEPPNFRQFQNYGSLRI